MILKDIAQVNIGLVIARVKYSGGEPCGEVATYKYFTLSSAEHDLTIDKYKLKDIEVGKKIDAKYISREGDIIIGISAPHSVAYIDAASVGIIIPSQFVAVRVADSRILPEYLAAYLNSEDVKSQMDKISKGELIKTFNAEKLQQLAIPILPLERQQKIANLNRLIQEDNHLGFQLAKLQKAKNDCYLNKFLAHGEEQS